MKRATGRTSLRPPTPLCTLIAFAALALPATAASGMNAPDSEGGKEASPIADLRSRETAAAEALAAAKRLAENGQADDGQVDDGDQVQRSLRAINEVLAQSLAPACSQWLLGFPLEDASLNLVRESVAFCDQTAAALAPRLASGGDTDEDALRQARLRRDLDTLMAFARAFEALLLPSDDGSNRRRAATGVSLVLEHEDAALADAAALWYAALRGAEEDKEPAITVLPWPLSPAGPRLTPYGFFGRLLRCGLIESDQRPLAGLTILMQMDEKCETWFNTEESRERARLAIGWKRLRLMESWRARMDADADPDAVKAWEERMSGLRDDLTGDGAPAPMGLDLAIPLLERFADDGAD